MTGAGREAGRAPPLRRAGRAAPPQGPPRHASRVAQRPPCPLGDGPGPLLNSNRTETAAGWAFVGAPCRHGLPYVGNQSGGALPSSRARPQSFESPVGDGAGIVPRAPPRHECLQRRRRRRSACASARRPFFDAAARGARRASPSRGGGASWLSGPGGAALWRRGFSGAKSGSAARRCARPHRAPGPRFDGARWASAPQGRNRKTSWNRRIFHSSPIKRGEYSLRRTRSQASAPTQAPPPGAPFGRALPRIGPSRARISSRIEHALILSSSCPLRLFARTACAGRRRPVPPLLLPQLRAT